MNKLTATLALALLVGCSSNDGDSPDTEPPPHAGTWVNEDSSVQKVVIQDSGDFRAYADLDETILYREGTCTIVEAWTDDAGDHWATEDCIDTDDTTWFQLYRLSAGDSVLEVKFGYDDYPEDDGTIWPERYERADS